MKATGVKVGVILIVFIGVFAYVLDDIFYYSDIHTAEIFVYPIAILLTLGIVVGLIMPSYQKSRLKG
ncbi:hypothetical protein FLK61_24635 [Paenalkalicoccus suaedae]|uniref:Uncharacterized protein n=1 Tax=Paenalkalicoccus suaedae TaxID=2592382 RepID=A0A859FCM5_9BACI|nr:hypothetical protein [Paenalkalicoccus suaedae]QKS69966.1 hypothetical protein FLK61_24635 [Paenalkalicoccus suaedae]